MLPPPVLSLGSSSRITGFNHGEDRAHPNPIPILCRVATPSLTQKRWENATTIRRRASRRKAPSLDAVLCHRQYCTPSSARRTTALTNWGQKITSPPPILAARSNYGHAIVILLMA
ncbi:hypothetical protein RJ55_08178 [Drechmeria coniospora]|nr:hypothetical protein RJ55_08178 [Drechmeria coniospora]